MAAVDGSGKRSERTGVSDHPRAAGDRDVDVGEEAGLIAGERKRGAGDVLGLRNPARGSA